MIRVAHLSHLYLEKNIESPDFIHCMSVDGFLKLLGDYIEEFADPSSMDRPTINLRVPYILLDHYPSAIATFYAPSDNSGISGMRREWIRAVETWRKEGSRFDTVFFHTNPKVTTITSGLAIGCVCQFFSFYFRSERHTCVLLHHFEVVGNAVDEDTGMWIVRPLFQDSKSLEPRFSILPLCYIYRAAHLIPVYDEGDMEEIPNDFTHSQTLDNFRLFYVNKFIDHHAFITAI